MTAQIKLTDAYNASACDPTTCVFDVFYNARDVASSRASIGDLSVTT